MMKRRIAAASSKTGEAATSTPFRRSQGPPSHQRLGLPRVERFLATAFRARRRQVARRSRRARLTCGPPRNSCELQPRYSLPDGDRREHPIVRACRRLLELVEQADFREAGVLEETDRFRLRIRARRGGATVMLGGDRDAILDDLPAIFR